MKGLPAGYAIAIVCSLVLHSILVAFAIMGWTSEQREVKVQPRYIQARLLTIDPSKQSVKKASPKKSPVKKAPVKKTPVKKAPIKKSDTSDQQKQKQLAKQRAEKERQVRARKAKEKKRREELARQERVRKDKERKKREAEAEKRAQQEAQRRAQELAFADALDDEEDYIAAGEDEQLVGSYSAYIAERIASNWSRPPSARRDMEVILSIQMVPTGRVVSVSVAKSSGNGAFDRSAEQAVHKVGQFYKLQELAKAKPQLFEREFRRFRLVFKPDDLRL